MSLLVFYNALLSTLGKHLGIIGTLTNTTALWCHLVCENELSLLERKVRVGAQPGGMYWVDGQFFFQFKHVSDYYGKKTDWFFSQ